MVSSLKNRSQKILRANEQFFDIVSGVYDYIFGRWIKGIQKRVIDMSNLREGQIILDAGCGTGNFLVLLDKFGKGFRLYGVDISRGMLKMARMKIKNKADLKFMSVEDLKFKPNYFDHIFSIDSFHHYADQRRAMWNFKRVLKRGGNLAVVDLDFGRFFNNLFHLIEPGNNKIYSKREFNKIFEESGFKEIKHESVGWFSVMTSGKI